MRGNKKRTREEKGSTVRDGTAIGVSRISAEAFDAFDELHYALLLGYAAAAKYW